MPRLAQLIRTAQDELKKLAQEFPEIKTVLEDSANHHQGITDEFQSVTDDLESGSADKPTAIERVRAQSERLKAERDLGELRPGVSRDSLQLSEPGIFTE
ncbi:hypothetical protein MY4038_002174 [Beauveria bassiana]